MPAPITLPAGCSSPAARWPFARAQSAVRLLACTFRPNPLDQDDFRRAGIQAPPGILRAAAKRQSEFLAGRLCAHAALAGHDDPQVGVDDQGAPQWPAGLCGSITHSHGLAAAVVADRQHWLGIGLDAELPMSASRALRLAQQILSPAERRQLAGRTEAEQAWLVSLTFCSKESLFKALYPLVGQRFYFQDAELLDWADGSLRLQLLRDLGPQWPAGSLLHGQHGTLDSHLLSLVGIANPPAPAETPRRPPGTESL